MTVMSEESYKAMTTCSMCGKKIKKGFFGENCLQTLNRQDKKPLSQTIHPLHFHCAKMIVKKMFVVKEE